MAAKLFKNELEPEAQLVNSEAHNVLAKFEQEGLRALGPISENLEEYWTTINLPSGFKSKIKVVRPKAATSTSSRTRHPLIVLFYGGGYAYGSPDQVTTPARDFAQEFGAVVVCPDYRHVPTVRWPVPFEDGYDIIVYLSEHAEKEFGTDLDTGFVVGGLSSGGGIASVAVAVSVFGDNGERKELSKLKKPVTGVFASIPLLLVEEIIPARYKDIWTSREDNRDSPNLTTANVEEVINGLQIENYKSAWFTPINTLERATNDSQNGHHPPVYIQVCKLDPLRDDGVIYEKVLKDQGISTKIDVFPDDGHNCWNVMPFRNNSKNPTFEEATMEGIKWLLGRHS
jgi:acetyl esterase/lipase